jgi:hypothetical protein
MGKMLAIFGPVPSGGSSTLPGFILFAVGLFGFISLPVQIRKMQPIKSHWVKLGFTVAWDLGFVIGGLVMVSHGLKR